MDASDTPILTHGECLVYRPTYRCPSRVSPAHAVVEGRLPLKHHHTSFQVFAEGESRSRPVWITENVPPRCKRAYLPHLALCSSYKNSVRDSSATSGTREITDNATKRDVSGCTMRLGGTSMLAERDRR